MKNLLSVGLDVGTTSTQMIVSRLGVENRASAFSVPNFVIDSREILYESPIYFTPLLDDTHIDMRALRQIVEKEYQSAGITPEEVDTGAVIITGETARRENADAVLRSLSHLAGEFVVATAGPDLESVLAAKGAGAAAWSEDSGRWVLHFDIGGGTANMALIDSGVIRATGCLNVGGRLLKIDKTGRVTYVSPALRDLTDLKVGDMAEKPKLQAVAENLTMALEAAAGLRPDYRVPASLITNHLIDLPNADLVISFSGGVADCIEQKHPDTAFGDIGPILGQAIKGSRLCAGEYRLGRATIRATVIGAGSYSTTLSGSTVHVSGVRLPMKNLPVAVLTEEEQNLPADALSECIREKNRSWEEPVALYLPGTAARTYGDLSRLARGIVGAVSPIAAVVLERDMAKALGQAIQLLQPGEGCLCIDGVVLHPGDYLDVGCPVGGALPVVIKTLILSQ